MMIRKHTIAQISFLIACGSALQLAEMFIPFPVPIPGLRIGLANIGTLLALVLFGVPAGIEVAVFRPVITSLTNGTFLAPGFVIGFISSLAGVAAMAVVYLATRKTRFFSVITVGIIGAVSHNVAAVAVAYAWLLPHKVVLAFIPMLAVAALIGGGLVGWSARYVLRRLEDEKLSELPSFDRPETEAPSQGLRLRDKGKILAAFLLVLSTIFLKTISAYAFLTALVLVLILVYRETASLVPRRMLSLWGAVVFSFLLPALFATQGEVVWQWGIVRVTSEGVLQGCLFALRLLFLIMISVWIGVADPSTLSQELAWILSPLRYLNFSVNRVPRIVSLSLSFIPVIWEKFAQVKPKTLVTILEALVIFFVGLEQSPHAESPQSDAVTPAGESDQS